VAPEFAGDTVTTWDAQVGSLRTQLGLLDPDNELVFFFAMNQTKTNDPQRFDNGTIDVPVAVQARDPLTGQYLNSTVALQAQDMLIWVRMYVTDSAGNIKGNSYYINGSASGTPTGPDVDAPVDNTGYANKQFVHVHGQIVVDKTTGQFIRYGDTILNPNEKVVTQNLGDNQAAFAVFNQQLSDLVKTSDPTDVFKMDLRYAFNTNGPEAIWAQSTKVRGGVIPEASSLSIWALIGLSTAIGAWRRRRIVQ
jgi:hypothetical protein